MNQVELDNLKVFLEKLAPTNGERIEKLKSMLMSAPKEEIRQLDGATLTWLLGIVMEAERKEVKLEVTVPFRKGPVGFVSFPSDMRVREDDDFDEADYQWGI